MIIEDTDFIAANAPRETPHVPVIVIGGGQAGLSASWFLQRHCVEHLILEKNRIGHSWRDERWDSFCLVTPNWQCLLPDFPYQGDDPNGFMLKDEIVAYVEAFAAKVKPPIREGVAVTALSRDRDGRFRLCTTSGDYTADKVILAVSGYHIASIPRVGERLPSRLFQIHSQQYRNPDQIPDGGVLVVGTGQSGCQIAEDLYRVGRQAHLAVGTAPRSPRKYRGRDALDWLHEMGQYDITVDDHPLREKVRLKENHYFSGRDGGREIDLREFARGGMKLYGMLSGVEGEQVAFADDLKKNLDAADAAFTKIRKQIDAYIAAKGVEAPPPPAPYTPLWEPAEQPQTLDLAESGVNSVIWCTGFRPDWRWIDVPVFNGEGYPVHYRGVSKVDGLYVVGLPWLTTWGSGRFLGLTRDVEHVVKHLASRLEERTAA
ncbi:MAG TPA: MSMEG_0569 family flavin-dependent oxidoreductase [Caulobacteraceae bacterium]|jgi:putative flavoprotein involved in K+ transport